VDPLTLLWIFSLLGAGGFVATGYWYGRMKVAEEIRAAEARGKSDPDVHQATTVPPPDVGASAEALEKAKAEAKQAAIEEATAEKDAAVEAAAREADERNAAQRVELEERSAEQRAAAEDALRQVAVLREELRVEILARSEAERRAADLTSRLVSSSQQVAALRARAGMTPEAPPVRGSSLTPPAPRVSAPPSMSPQRMQSLAPGLFGELEELRREVERLKRENETLRVAAFVKKSE
jgi:colicin import membrane protein